MVPVGIYLALAPSQLIGQLRIRWPGYRRLAGRALGVVGETCGQTSNGRYVVPIDNIARPPIDTCG